MIIIGLTGGIGTGKSTAANILSSLKFPVHSADEAVHRLLAKGGLAVRPIAENFPEVIKRGTVNRRLLGKIVFGDHKKLKLVERILHPLVRRDERAFLKAERKNKSLAVVLEIPLLFETGAEARCDIVICMSAPRQVQKARVLKRKGMTESKFKAIITHQMRETEKRKYADFVVRSEKGFADTKRQLKRILRIILNEV